MTFNKYCPMCKQSPEYNMDISYDQLEKWLTDRDAMVQNLFPDLPLSDREVLLTGCCYTCQNRIYGE
jgi:hypothetical protein